MHFNAVVRTSSFLVALTCACILQIAATHAATLNVPASFPTIQQAIDAAVPGDTVAVAPGLYLGPIAMKPSVDVIGSGFENTILDGEGLGNATGSVVAAADDAVISGFTVRNANLAALGNVGACIDARLSSPIIRQNWLTNCRIGIGTFRSPTIERNVIVDNDTTIGTGIFVSTPSGVPGSSVAPLIRNNTIVNNVRGVLLAGDPSASVVNNLLVSNITGMRGTNEAAAVIRFNDVFGNDVDYSELPDLTGVDGNISVDPLFVDPLARNFQLEPASPVIDAGDPSSPLDPDETVADIGAFPVSQSFAGNALQLDGVDDFVRVVHDISLSLDTFTFEGWFRPALPLERSIAITKGVGFGNYSLSLSSLDSGATNRLALTYRTPTGNYSKLLGTPVFSEWTHIAISRSSTGEIRSYINGQPTPTTCCPSPVPLQNDEDLHFGGFVSGVGGLPDRFFYGGLLDELRIWDVALEPESVAANFGCNVLGDTPGLVGYWNFDETIDSQVVVDSSLDGNDGTLGATDVVEDTDPVRAVSSAPVALCVAALAPNFIDFEQRGDGRFVEGPFVLTPLDEYQELGVIIVDSFDPQGPNELLLSKPSPILNETGLEGYVLVATASGDVTPTFVEVELTEGTREIAFDFVDPSGEIRVIAFNAANEIVDDATYTGTERFENQVANEVVSLLGGSVFLDFGENLQRIRVEAPLNEAFFLDNLRFEAAIPETTQIAADVQLGPGTTVGSDAMIETGVVVGADTTISDEALIARDTIIGSDVFLGVGSLVARDATIGDGSSIGDSVRVERAANIGTETSLGNEIAIERDCFIGNEVEIGDRTSIGKNCLIGDRVKIGSDTRVEKVVEIGADAIVGNEVVIGRDSTVPSFAEIPDGTAYP